MPALVNSPVVNEAATAVVAGLKNARSSLKQVLGKLETAPPGEGLVLNGYAAEVMAGTLDDARTAITAQYGNMRQLPSNPLTDAQKAAGKIRSLADLIMLTSDTVVGDIKLYPGAAADVRGVRQALKGIIKRIHVDPPPPPMVVPPGVMFHPWEQSKLATVPLA